MLPKEILKQHINSGISQVAFAKYLGITRQTVAKIARDEYYKFKEEAVYKLEALKNRSKEEVESIMKIDSKLEDIKNVIIKGDSKYLNEAFQGIDYMHYWLNDKKFREQPKYHKYYFGHMNNFYPRYNQAALFMRDTLERQKYPLVTFQIDYKNKLITSASIKAFNERFHRLDYNLKKVKFPISFKEFINLLDTRIQPKNKFLLYLDYIDNDWEFIKENLDSETLKGVEIYDLSRLLNFFDNEQPYYGPLIEDALENFRIKFEKEKLFTDCTYRAEKIIELINLISLDALASKKQDRSSYLFDSHGLIRENNYIKLERRKLKGN